MNSLLLTLTAVLILVLSALFAAPLFIDWNDYRPAIRGRRRPSCSAARSRWTARSIWSCFRPRSSNSTTSRSRTQDGSLDTPFLEAKSLEAKIDVGTLLTGKVEAHKLTMIDPTLRLELERRQAAATGAISDQGQAGGPFVPKDVLLNSVRVSGGTVEIQMDGVPTFVFTDIDGEASAASLAGPYKVSASYDFEGRPQSIRLSTGAMGSSGQFRMKAALRDPERSASYQLDGVVSGLRTIPAYDGSLLLRMSKLNSLGVDEPPQGDGAPMPVPEASRSAGPNAR